MLGGINPLMMGGGVSFTTWNPLDKNANITLSNGNLTAASSVQDAIVRSTRSRSAGKFYAEATCVGSPGNGGVGVANASASLSLLIGQDANAIGYRNTSAVYQNNGFLTAQATYGSGDVIGIAVDLTAAKVWFSLTGTFTGNPATNSGGYSISGLGPLFLAASPNAGQFVLNVGGSAFASAPPSDFSAWG